jgi:multiple sugar transport system permease protein
MSVLHQTVAAHPTSLPHHIPDKGEKGQWWRFLLLLAITVIVLITVVVVIWLSVRPGANSTSTAFFTLSNFTHVFADTQTLTWLGNSLAVTLGVVVVSVVVAAPAGYVLSRGRSRAVSGYSLLLFVVQSLPVITSVIPLFILFAKLHLVDNLLGLGIIYVGASMSVAVWMMAAYMDSIPGTLEEAAWIDGASVFGGFWRIVLRNSLPGVLSTAVFTFLVSWNDYLVAIVFMRTSSKFTLPLGVESFFQQNVTDWGSVMAVAIVMMAPPVLVFAVLNRYFSVGGIGGSLAGQ